ncbi:MAG TPA: glycosyltransferase [Chloroflexia bacterium]|nr:glycosyltransferase [Chloroflexia bacterium]
MQNERAGQGPAGAPWVSVIIPAYQAARTLPATLAALRQQTYPADRVEVLVVDDGSTDATAAVAAAGGARVLTQANQGPATARNRGARAAHGTILLFTDADCVPTPNWIARMVAPFADPRVEGVKGAYRTHQRGLTARFAQVEFAERYGLQQRAPTIDVVDSYAAAFRRARFVAAGGYDERFWTASTEDTELSYRLAEGGARLVFAPDAIVYHTHPPTLARYLRVKFARGYWKLVVYRMYRGRALRDSYTPQLLKVQGLGALGVAALAPCALAWPPLRRPWALGLAALMASTAPFTAFAARRDLALAWVAPACVLLRGLAIGAGTAAAVLGLGRGLAHDRDPRGTFPAAECPAAAGPEVP